MKRSPRLALLNGPYLLWSTLFIIIPLFIVAYYAFTDSSGAFTLHNIAILGEYSQTFAISILYSLEATAICLLLSFPFAYFMSRRSAEAQRTTMVLVMLPMWMNLLILTYSWMNILEKNGVINNLLSLAGLQPVTMIGTPGAVVLGMVYNYLPYMILPIFTVMSKINPSLLQAADDLGANALQRLRKVILPLSLPGILSGIIMVFVPSVSTFYISQKLGGGMIMLIGDVIDRQIQTSYNYNLGAALSLVLMVFVLISLGLLNRVTSAAEGEEMMLV